MMAAGELNPGPWVKHSLNTGIAARNIARLIPTLNENKAYILGALHDIGRRVGVIRMQDEFQYEPTTKEEISIKRFILDCEFDDYDRLIQLCDALATDYGFVILEKRMVDVTRRYGIMESYIKGWDMLFEMKDYYENLMGCSIYDVLPDIGKTTLLSPPPWKPSTT